MSEIDEAMGLIRSLKKNLDCMQQCLTAASGVIEHLPRSIQAAAESEGETPFDHSWKDGNRLTYEGKQEFFRLVRSGEKPTAIALRLRMTLAAVNYQLSQMALKAAATA